jgi:hypothetical protein
MAPKLTEFGRAGLKPGADQSNFWRRSGHINQVIQTCQLEVQYCLGVSTGVPRKMVKKM